MLGANESIRQVLHVVEAPVELPFEVSLVVALQRVARVTPVEGADKTVQWIARCDDNLAESIQSLSSRSLFRVPW